MTTRGAVYIAYGSRALSEYWEASQSLKKHMPDLPIAMIGSDSAELGDMSGFTDVQKSRWAKVNLDKLSPFDHTLYLDADTRVYGDLSAGFDILDRGWDMALVTSENQGARLLWHVSREDKEATLKKAGAYDVLQIQCGVMFFRKSIRIVQFFSVWRREWLRFRGQDQGAFLRALIEIPVRLWLLGKPWNGGGIIAHLFGRARA